MFTTTSVTNNLLFYRLSTMKQFRLDNGIISDVMVFNTRLLRADVRIPTIPH